MDVFNLYSCDYASSYRNNSFRDYEQYPYGTLEGNFQRPQQLPKSYFTMVQEKLQRARQKAKSKKESCPFCKEDKKRPLNAYMRQRSQDKSSNSKICEESEEEEQSKCCPKTHGQAAANK